MENKGLKGFKVVSSGLEIIGMLFLINFVFNTNGCVLNGSSCESVSYLVSTMTDGADTHNSLVVLIVLYAMYLIYSFYAICKYSAIVNTVLELLLLTILCGFGYLFMAYGNCSLLLTVRFGNYSLLFFLVIFISLRMIWLAVNMRKLVFLKKF